MSALKEKSQSPMMFFFCSSDIVFARRSASYIVVYYRYGRCLPVCTTLLPSRKMYRNIRNASLQTPSPVVKYVWQTVQLLPEPPWLPDLAGAPLPVSLLFCLAPWTLKMVLLSLLLVASEFPACSALWNWMRCLAARSGWETRLRKEKLCFCLVKKLFFFFFSLEKESHPTLPQASSARRTHTVCLTTETWLAHSFCALFALVHI